MTLPEFPTESPGYPEASQAVTAVVLGIIGIFFSPVAPFAWFIGEKELKAIESGLRPPENRGVARAGKILGIIGTVLLILGMILLVVVFFWVWSAFA